MIGRLPGALCIDGTERKIRTDFRDILVIMEAFNDPELDISEQFNVALTILYEAPIPEKDIPEAIKQALWFLDCGKISDEKKPAPRVMDWEQDETIIFPAINKVAGKEVRSLDYMHWWTFIGYFMEIDEGTFSMVMGIRQKKNKGKKLEKWEQEFYRNNQGMCVLKKKYTNEEQEEIEKLNKLLG